MKSKSVEIKPEFETFAKIKVVGVGGSGGSAINRMVKSKIRGIDFIAINTDAQALQANLAADKIQIGRSTTKGLGAGMDPDIGAQAAEENEEEIKKTLAGADMVFITCGLGGGTGSGASHVIADIAKGLGILTVAVVTRPFTFEGAQRRNIAERAFELLRDKVDAIITIPNDRLLQVIDKKTSLLDAFAIVDEVLKQGVQGIAEIITVPALVNVDFADVKAIMRDAGSALMGIGRASGDDRAVEAARAAVDSTLLELSIKGARGVLFTIAGGANLTMHEVNEAAEVITASVDNNAKIIFGAMIDETLGDEIKITVIATGFSGQPARTEKTIEDYNSPHEKPNNISPIMHTPLPPRQSESSANIPKNIFTKKPKTLDNPVIQSPIKTEEEDELEIPTFIRKKIGK